MAQCQEMKALTALDLVAAMARVGKVFRPLCIDNDFLGFQICVSRNKFNCGIPFIFSKFSLKIKYLSMEFYFRNDCGSFKNH